MTLLTYDQAIEQVLTPLTPLPTVELPLALASGRFLAEDVISAIDLPRFDNSQMDGYALCAADVSNATCESPVALRVIGTAAAGKSMQLTLSGGQTAKIFTGAPMPDGADSVAPIEDVVGQEGGRSVTFPAPVEVRQFVRFAGEDLRAGTVIARRGEDLTPGRLALLASVGCGAAKVYRQAAVAILTNGDELADPSTHPGDLLSGQIYESNGLMLAALADQAGAKVVVEARVPDSRDALVKKISEIVAEFSPDLIISTGGVSVGDRDYIRSVLSELGEIVFWRASIRPGKPILYGKIASSRFLGLPGNPASTLVTFELFARPLISKLHGGAGATRFLPTKMNAAVSHQPGRRSFVRSCTTITADGLVSAVMEGQGSHFLTSLSKANSLVVVPEDVSGLEAGSAAMCLLTGPVAGE